MPACKNSAEENKHITRILAYSAIKIKANLPALYSVLNPETNSLSPSAKSNGARLVSAIHVKSHNKAIGDKVKVKGNRTCLIVTKKSKDQAIIKTAKRSKDIDTS